MQARFLLKGRNPHSHYRGGRFSRWGEWVLLDTRSIAEIESDGDRGRWLREVVERLRTEGTTYVDVGVFYRGQRYDAPCPNCNRAYVGPNPCCRPEPAPQHRS